MEGITRELEELKAAGLNRVTMFSVADVTMPWAGTIANSPTPEIIAFSKPWWNLVQHALKECKRLRIDFGMHNCPGDTASGDPWIPVEYSMQQLCFSDTIVRGPSKYKIDLPLPEVKAQAFFPIFNPNNGKVEVPAVPEKDKLFNEIAIIALPSEGNVSVNQIIDLSGEKKWSVPSGEWTIYRFGYATKGNLIQPAQWEATGYECDKMNPEAVTFHLNHVIKEVKQYAGDYVSNVFSHIHFDSYEAGIPGWTPKMRSEFKNRRGYDLLPFLATFAKRTVSSKEETKKFQKDFYRTIEELYRDVYFTLSKKILNEAGLDFCVEPYGGPWNQKEIMPLIDRVMTEFWTNNGQYTPYEVDNTIAALRKSGQNLIEAEAFTGLPEYSRFNENPQWLKPIGDAAFCAGINRFLLCEYVHQPWGNKYLPGMTMGRWGTHFYHTQTWWNTFHQPVLYWNRCQTLLQWGNYATTPGDCLVEMLQSHNLDIRAIHRKQNDIHIFFLSNIESDKGGDVNIYFDVTDIKPELWDPVWGTVRDLPEYEVKDGKTKIKLKFHPTQSYFIVFRNNDKPFNNTKRNFSKILSSKEIDGPWKVNFDQAWGGPVDTIEFTNLKDWTQSSDPRIKYYSGTAVYSTTFDAPEGGTSISFGSIKDVARVFLNGHELGIVWCEPWSVNLPDGILKEKNNKLMVELTNTWANRLIGDEQEVPDTEWEQGMHTPGSGYYLKSLPQWLLSNGPRPSKNRYCFTTWNYFTKDSPLNPAGLFGTVKLLQEKF